jgi:hypothetical protein
MSNILRVQWTIVPQKAPQPSLNCNRCGGARTFLSTDKIRINANGKRLDAWLIYKCVACDNTWNRPIFTRRLAVEMDRDLLRALQADNGECLRAIAFDVEGLKRYCDRIEEFSDATVQKELLYDGDPPIAKIEILIRAPLPASLRLDRLLAAEFEISRTRIQELEAKGLLTLSPHGGRMLRRSVKDQTRIDIDLSRVDLCAAGRALIAAAASGARHKENKPPGR